MRLRKISLRNLALLVGDWLRRRGVQAVLTGGACVSIYTRNRYQSYDLDFVLLAAEDRKIAGQALAELGFRPVGRHFRHPDTPFLVEFLAPPLSIGAAPVRKTAEISAGQKILRLLSPTDCVKDRLAAFYFWNDRQALDQAVLVASRHPADLKDIREWSASEGMTERLAGFLRLLKEKKKRKAGR